ncbi:MAG: hypothetical protein AAF497_15815 [Planctomycetota bacterium]
MHERAVPIRQVVIAIFFVGIDAILADCPSNPRLHTFFGAIYPPFFLTTSILLTQAALLFGWSSNGRDPVLITFPVALSAIAVLFALFVDEKAISFIRMPSRFAFLTRPEIVLLFTSPFLVILIWLPGLLLVIRQSEATVFNTKQAVVSFTLLVLVMGLLAQRQVRDRRLVVGGATTQNDLNALWTMQELFKVLSSEPGLIVVHAKLALACACCYWFARFVAHLRSFVWVPLLHVIAVAMLYLLHVYLTSTLQISFFTRYRLLWHSPLVAAILMFELFWIIHRFRTEKPRPALAESSS